MATSSQELVNTRKPESDAGIDVEDDEDDVSGLNTKTFRLQQNCTSLCLRGIFYNRNAFFSHKLFCTKHWSVAYKVFQYSTAECIDTCSVLRNF